MDVALKNAMVLDGSGEPGQICDVGITGDRITNIGQIDSSEARRVYDLSGLVLAPGFLDIHTHYDAQVLWDPDLTPSCWHGVTSVVAGNCGFGLAPTRAEHRSLIIETLENVEGMSSAALDQGIQWGFETYEEYRAVLESIPRRLNIGTLAGHTPIRLYVMGTEAAERPATPEEVAHMKHLVTSAMSAGALGFATSRSPVHMGARGLPIPSRLADDEEIKTLIDAIGGAGIVQSTAGPGFFIKEYAEFSKRWKMPITWTSLLTDRRAAGMDLSGMEEMGLPSASLLDVQSALGGQVWPQISCRPLSTQFTLAQPPATMAMLGSFAAILQRPGDERKAVYSDPQWQEQARPEVMATWSRWAKTTVAETQRHPEVAGLSLEAIALQWNTTPFDAMVAVALADDLATRFGVVIMNDDEDELGILLRDRRTLLGLSDAGAHASQLCDAGYATYLLGHWVRKKKALTLEQAIWRLTAQPASIFRIKGRGLIREGYYADLVAFDPDTVGCGDLQRVRDLPGNEDRLIAPSQGIEFVWVNGSIVRAEARDVDGVAPGMMLKPPPRAA
jgi:N-acyl-D-amino-acid deacylase